MHFSEPGGLNIFRIKSQEGCTNIQKNFLCVTKFIVPYIDIIRIIFNCFSYVFHVLPEPFLLTKAAASTNERSTDETEDYHTGSGERLKICMSDYFGGNCAGSQQRMN